MKRKLVKYEHKGLPGGPNEQFSFSSSVFSTHGYKRNSPDVNNPFNIIPSGNITMKGVDFPVLGIDNLGNSKMMQPGFDYQFPGNTVFELPMAQFGVEKTYVHQPGTMYNPDLNTYVPGESYMLKRTVTPYTTKRDIRRFTKEASDPREINFISNYAGAIGEPLSKDFEYPTSVPFEGNKHWNIDRFIIDPHFTTNYGRLESFGSSKKELKNNVLADMYKYFMLQNEGNRRDAWRQARKFFRQEINPRINGPLYEGYLRNRLLPGAMNGITNAIDDNYLESVNNLIGDANKEYDDYPKLDINGNQVFDSDGNPVMRNDRAYTTRYFMENPVSKNFARRMGMQWLTDYKKMSRRDAKNFLRNSDKPYIDYSNTDLFPFLENPTRQYKEEDGRYYMRMPGSNSPHSMDWRPITKRTYELAPQYQNGGESANENASSLVRTPYTGPRQMACPKEGCATIVRMDLEKMLPSRGPAGSLGEEDAWYKKAATVRGGGAIIWENPRGLSSEFDPSELDYSQLQVGDMVSLWRGSDAKKNLESQSGLPMTANEGNEHVGYIIGFDTDGTPLIKHGAQNGMAYVQRIDETIGLPAYGSFVGASYTPVSIYRAADFMRPQTQEYINRPRGAEDQNPEELIFNPRETYTNRRVIDAFTGGTGPQARQKNRWIDAINNAMPDVMNVTGLGPQEVSYLGKLAFSIPAMESSFDRLPSRLMREGKKQYKNVAWRVFAKRPKTEGMTTWPLPAKRNGFLELPGEGPATHQYEWGSTDNGYVVYPTLFQTDNGEWYQVPKEQTFEEAKKRGEVIEFDNKRDAELYATDGIWKGQYDWFFDKRIDTSPSLGPTQIKYDDIYGYDNRVSKKGAYFDALGVKRSDLTHTLDYRSYPAAARATMAVLAADYQKLREDPTFNPETNTVFNNVPISDALYRMYSKGSIDSRGRDYLENYDVDYANKAAEIFDTNLMNAPMPPVFLPEMEIKRDRQRGGEPIYVTDPNDPRLQAYQDSLKYFNLVNSFEIESPEGFPYLVHRPRTHRSYISSRHSRFNEIPENFIRYRNFTGDSDTDWGLIKKPTQPVIYQPWVKPPDINIDALHKQNLSQISRPTIPVPTNINIPNRQYKEENGRYFMRMPGSQTPGALDWRPVTKRTYELGQYQNGAEFNWTPIGGQQNLSATPSINPTYNVTVTDGSGVKATTNPFNIQPPSSSSFLDAMNQIAPAYQQPSVISQQYIDQQERARNYAETMQRLNQRAGNYTLPDNGEINYPSTDLRRSLAPGFAGVMPNWWSDNTGYGNEMGFNLFMAEPFLTTAGGMWLDPKIARAGQYIANTRAGQAAGRAASQVGDYLTTQTPLRNAYKYNPWAFKPNPEAYYHRSPNIENIINQETRMLQGFGESSVGKAFTESTLSTKGINLKKGANSRLYFSKGVPLDYGRYNMRKDPKTGKLIPGQGYKGPYLVEVEGVPMGASTKGRAPGAEPTKIGSYAVSKRPISLDEAKFYKEDWLRGYKPIKAQGGSTSKVTDDMLLTYKNYINNQDNSKEAEKIYDKLNRVYRMDAKKANMSIPNYIMTRVIK